MTNNSQLDVSRIDVSRPRQLRRRGAFSTLSLCLLAGSEDSTALRNDRVTRGKKAGDQFYLLVRNNHTGTDWYVLLH